MFKEIDKIINQIHSTSKNKDRLYGIMRLYKYIKNEIKNSKRILEIGCNKGYGCYFLATNSNKTSIIGVDINKQDLNYAKKEFKHNNIIFDEMNVFNKNSQKKIRELYGRFNVIICIEVLEHIPPQKINIFFNGIRYLLDENGILFLSIPNKKIYDIDSFSKDHINEMDYGEILKLINKNNFKIMDIFGINSLNKFVKKILLDWKLVKRINNKKINLSKIQRTTRICILSILSPNKIFSELLKRINKNKWNQFIYKSFALQKDYKNSKILLFKLSKQ